jgi:hypothetical protein
MNHQAGESMPCARSWSEDGGLACLDGLDGL